MIRRGAALLVAAGTALGACAPAPVAIGPAPHVPATARSVRLDVQTAQVNGRRVAWAELGTGTPLVLLNGTGSPMAEWDPLLLAELATHRRVIVYDYPGLGGSQRLAGRLTFDRLAQSLDGLLEQLGLRQVDVLGWSMGTFVAQRLAVRHPEVLRRLILVGGNPGGSRTVLGPRWVQRADSDPDAGTKTYLKTNFPRTGCAQAAGRRFLNRQALAVESGRYPPDRVPPRTYDAMVAAEDPWLRSNRNSREIKGITAPTLIMVGSKDVITPPSNSTALRRLIPGAVLRVLGDSGHSALFQDPAVGARVVDQFLTDRLTGATRQTVATSCS